MTHASDVTGFRGDQGKGQLLVRLDLALGVCYLIKRQLTSSAMIGYDCGCDVLVVFLLEDMSSIFSGKLRGYSEENGGCYREMGSNEGGS